MNNKNSVAIVAIFMAFSAWAQPHKKVSPSLINDRDSFYSMVKHDTLQTMVELKSIIPGVLYELRYADKKNFTGKRLYPKNTHTTYLRLKPA